MASVGPSGTPPAADPALSAVILLRTQEVDAPLSAFAAELERLSGFEAIYLIDERKGPAAIPDGRQKIGLTAERCRALGLHCPGDFAWRCGDYGFYLARERLPGTGRFWMIESDVRLAGRDPGRFFARFAEDAADLLASFIEPAPPDWYWYGSVVSRDREAWKCFFPVVRLSARAVDLLADKRREHSRQRARRAAWANDEAFVATGVIGSGLTWADFNSAQETFYTPDAFAFDTLHALGEPLAAEGEARLFHPVLSREALARKRERLAQRSAPPGALKRLGRKVAARVGPAAWAQRLNRQRPW